MGDTPDRDMESNPVHGSGSAPCGGRIVQPLRAYGGVAVCLCRGGAGTGAVLQSGSSAPALSPSVVSSNIWLAQGTVGKGAQGCAAAASAEPGAPMIVPHTETAALAVQRLVGSWRAIGTLTDKDGTIDVYSKQGRDMILQAVIEGMILAGSGAPRERAT